MYEPMSGCWLWIGLLNDNGYGVTNRSGEQRTLYAHRAAWELFRGPVPEGMNVLHRCDVKCCVNPDHLFLGTLGDNNRDTVAKGRNARGERSPHARLTEAQVREIRRRHAAGEMIFSLAREFGLAKPHVWKICARQLWKHLD
jgi:hypothetical protein